MFTAKLKGEPFVTEYPMPVFDRVAPNPAVKDMKNAVIALVTSGGICPKGNPDHIEASSASKFGEYDITGVMDLTSDGYCTAHGGYDATYADQDADRVLPRGRPSGHGKAGVFQETPQQVLYTTVGNGTARGQLEALRPKKLPAGSSPTASPPSFSPPPEAPALVAAQRWSRKSSVQAFPWYTFAP